jgi:integrase
MQLNLQEYVTYIRAHKKVTPKTIRAYEGTLRAIGIDKIDTDKLPELYSELLKVMPKKGYVHVKRYVAILSAWAHRNGIEHLPKDVSYYTLYDEIKKSVNSKAAYTDDDIDTLFTVVRANDKRELYKAMLLMYYSGLRIGACKGLKYSDFTKVDGYDLYHYEVHSKGRDYQAIIPAKVIDYCRKIQTGGESLVFYDKHYFTEFTQLYREQLTKLLVSNRLKKLRDGKSIFQSFRKAYAQKLLSSSELDPLSYTYKALMGHLPKSTTATKFYITPDGKEVPLDLIKRMAKVYVTTDLYKNNVGIDEEWS